METKLWVVAVVGGLAGGVGWGALLMGVAAWQQRRRRASEEQAALEAWERLAALDRCYRVDGGPHQVNVN